MRPVLLVITWLSLTFVNQSLLLLTSCNYATILVILYLYLAEFVLGVLLYKSKQTHFFQAPV